MTPNQSLACMRHAGEMRQVLVVQLREPYEFNSPVPDTEFAAWILAADPSISPSDQMRVANQLVAAGCRYAVCSGHGSSSWDDAVDLAYVDRTLDVEDDAEHFVMTSWHNDETMDSIADFFVLNTAFDYFNPQVFLIVGIGVDAPVQTALTRAKSRLAGNAT